jgi:hypothetical protein
MEIRPIGYVKQISNELVPISIYFLTDELVQPEQLPLVNGIPWFLSLTRQLYFQTG